MKSLLLALVLIIASCLSADAGTVILSWDAIKDPTATKCNIYQSTSSTATKPWTKIGSVNMPAVTASFTVWSGTYFWYVTAASATIESDPSNVVTEVIPIGAPVITISIP